MTPDSGPAEAAPLSEPDPDHTAAAVFSEQVRLIYRLSRPVYAGTLAVALIMLLVLWNTVPAAPLLGWFTLVIAITAARHLLHRRYTLREHAHEAGFWAKWYAFLPAIKAGLYPLAVIGVVTSVVGAFYYLRIIKVMFFDEAAAPFEPVESKTFVVMALSAAFVVLFVLPFIGGALGDAATAAAASLTSGGR